MITLEAVKIEAVKTVLRLRPIVKNSDSGHGWFRVPFMALVALGIDNRISGYSYISNDGRDVWLEEDYDAAVFFNALTAAGIDKPPVMAVYRDGQSEIRLLASCAGGLA